MEYKLPPLPDPVLSHYKSDAMMQILGETNYYSPEQLHQYAEQAVAPLLAEIERLEKLHAVHPNLGLQQVKAQMGAGSFDAYVQRIVTGRP